MKTCARCLYPASKPDLHMDDDGLCAACRAFDKRKECNWDEREKHLVQILESNRRNGATYDCIVPSSGGKDSTWQVLKLLELGARPLVVTGTTCHLTDVGRANIDPDGSELINGSAASVGLTTQFHYRTLVSDGTTGWFVISSS